MSKLLTLCGIFFGFVGVVATAATPAPDPEKDFTTYYGNALELQGEELRQALHQAIQNGHTPIRYAQVWDALQLLDEDPNNPANIVLFYTGRSAEKRDRDGQPGFDDDSWNREHIWPVSYGFDREETYFAFTDLHHIRPTDKSVNSSRSNKRFAMGGVAEGEAPDTFTTANTWQPRAAIRGDVARMLFYMDVRYDGNDGGMPNLTLVDSTDMASGSTTFGKLCTLLAWHWADPVDEVESLRNRLIARTQGNRNPFIDNPLWAKELWGAACPDVLTPVQVVRPVFSWDSSAPASSAASASSQSANDGSGGGSVGVVLLLLLGVMRLRKTKSVHC